MIVFYYIVTDKQDQESWHNAILLARLRPMIMTLSFHKQEQDIEFLQHSLFKRDWDWESKTESNNQRVKDWASKIEGNNKNYNCPVFYEAATQTLAATGNTPTTTRDTKEPGNHKKWR